MVMSQILVKMLEALYDTWPRSARRFSRVLERTSLMLVVAQYALVDTPVVLLNRPNIIIVNCISRY
jgi:hypothetical protein